MNTLIQRALALLFIATVTALHAQTLYVSDGSQTIKKVTSGGAVSLFANFSPFSPVPYGLAFDTSGNLYAAGSSSDQISKITAEGVVSLFATLPVNSNPFGLAIDTAGNLYTANNNSNKISRITPDGLTVSTFATLPANTQPYGVAFDSSGNLFVTEITPHQIIN